MDRIEELEKEIELTKQLIELRKQLAAPQIILVPYVYEPQPVPQYPGIPNYPWITQPYVGDMPGHWPTITTC